MSESLTVGRAPAPAERPVGRVLIVSRAAPGFRRAGVTHPPRAEYPLGHFTEAEMAQLLAEPLLTVEVLRDRDPEGFGAPLGEYSVPAATTACVLSGLAPLSAEARARAETAGVAVASGSADAGVEARAALDTAALDAARGGTAAVPTPVAAAVAAVEAEAAGRTEAKAEGEAEAVEAASDEEGVRRARTAPAVGRPKTAPAR